MPWRMRVAVVERAASEVQEGKRRRRANLPDADVGIDGVGRAARLNLGRVTGVDRTRSTLGAWLSGVWWRGRVKPAHVRECVVPQGEDEHHPALGGLAHGAHATTLCKGHIATEGGFLRCAEVIRDGLEAGGADWQ
eukprot:CAMPEP_0174700408 /NCGR_PEP_ID=MMETSP1094-20130205/5367_1 /TAXON_ID=156173 /ORGANISM="Chrysochromulina brevifilum, Strain UTEX LB 985" /LENGTH=135 /DNA_ID=CAMNT_0015897883 /DNA_START=610 /DNA_END=1018 /DNA_ORIENTATION=+